MEKEIKKSYKLRVKLKGSHEWFLTTYKRVRGGFEIFIGRKLFRGISGPPCVYTNRRIARKNFSRFNNRRKILGKKLKDARKKNNLNMFTDYMWAKYWRKSKTLRKICDDLIKEPDLPVYSVSNKERVAQIIATIEESDKFFDQFTDLFLHVPENYAYGVETFQDFKKDLQAEQLEQLKRNRRMPREYHAYFNASSPY